MNAEQMLCLYAMEGIKHCCEQENVLTTARRSGLIVVCITGPSKVNHGHVLSQMEL